LLYMRSGRKEDLDITSKNALAYLTTGLRLQMKPEYDFTSHVLSQIDGDEDILCHFHEALWDIRLWTIFDETTLTEEELFLTLEAGLSPSMPFETHLSSSHAGCGLSQEGINFRWATSNGSTSNLCNNHRLIRRKMAFLAMPPTWIFSGRPSDEQFDLVAFSRLLKLKLRRMATESFITEFCNWTLNLTAGQGIPDELLPQFKESVRGVYLPFATRWTFERVCVYLIQAAARRNTFYDYMRHFNFTRPPSENVEISRRPPYFFFSVQSAVIYYGGSHISS